MAIGCKVPKPFLLQSGICNVTKFTVIKIENLHTFKKKRQLSYVRKNIQTYFRWLIIRIIATNKIPMKKPQKFGWRIASDDWTFQSNIIT